jgi:hypothetical protein
MRTSSTSFAFNQTLTTCLRVLAVRPPESEMPLSSTQGFRGSNRQEKGLAILTDVDSPALRTE